MCVDCDAHRQLPVVEVGKHEAVALLAIGSDDYVLGIDRALQSGEFFCGYSLYCDAHFDGQVDRLPSEEGAVDDGVPVDAVRVVAEAQDNVTVNREGLACN